MPESLHEQLDSALAWIRLDVWELTGWYPDGSTLVYAALTIVGFAAVAILARPRRKP